eukprot:175947-Pyramimonas_sp.AAC.1
MIGKRVTWKSCANNCSTIAIERHTSELSERSHGIRMGTRPPNVHKHIPEHPPHCMRRTTAKTTTGETGSGG